VVVGSSLVPRESAEKEASIPMLNARTEDRRKNRPSI